MTSRYVPVNKPLLYGLNVSYNRGYDYWSNRNAPTPEQTDTDTTAKKNTSSGYFKATLTDFQINVWVTEITAEFSLSGSVGQSRMLREFFPRSFNDITVRISGNVASSYEYNRLALFFREHQWNALNTIGQQQNADPTVTFHLDDNTPSGFANAQRGTKGAHKEWEITGYVKSMAAGATAHEVAPAFVIDFIVVASTFGGGLGLWEDDAIKLPAFKDFLLLVNIAEKAARATGAGFISNPVDGKVTALQTQGAINAVNHVADQVYTWSHQAVGAKHGWGRGERNP